MCILHHHVCKTLIVKFTHKKGKNWAFGLNYLWGVYREVCVRSVSNPNLSINTLQLKLVIFVRISFHLRTNQIKIKCFKDLLSELPSIDVPYNGRGHIFTQLTSETSLSNLKVSNIEHMMRAVVFQLVNIFNRLAYHWTSKMNG